jgi:hypothetical protein
MRGNMKAKIMSWFRNGGPDTTKAILGWIAIVSIVVSVAFALSRYLEINSAEWGVYLNAKFAQGVIQLVLAILVVVILECISRGFTIGAILDLRRDEQGSPPHPIRYLAAAILIVGFAYIGLESVKGALFTQ